MTCYDDCLGIYGSFLSFAFVFVIGICFWLTSGPFGLFIFFILMLTMFWCDYFRTRYDLCPRITDVHNQKTPERSRRIHAQAYESNHRLLRDPEDIEGSNNDRLEDQQQYPRGSTNQQDIPLDLPPPPYLDPLPTYEEAISDLPSYEDCFKNDSAIIL